jgi:hypothetical protein
MPGKFLAGVVGGIILFASSGAQAGMDYYCLSACQQAGYKHPYCAVRCATPAPGPSASPATPGRHGTDYRCVDKCTGIGRNRQYCLKNCTY